MKKTLFFIIFLFHFQVLFAIEPIKIKIEDPEDIYFLQNDPRISIGQVYEITLDAWFGYIDGAKLNVVLKPNDMFGKKLSITLSSRVSESFSLFDKVRVIFLYKPTEILNEPSFLNTGLISIQRR